MRRLTSASKKLVEKRQLTPVRDYLQSQSRFALLSDEQMAEVQAQVDEKWASYFGGV